MSKPRTHAIVSLLSHSPFTNPRLLPQKSLSSLSKFKPCKSLIILYLPAENQKKLITGFHQRYNVLPKAIDLEGNTKRVGFYQRIIIYHYSKKILTAGIHDSVTQFNIHAFSKNDFFNRTAKIFFQDDNHMHNGNIYK